MTVRAELISNEALHFNVYYRIDDIEDNSILRRGIPVAHSIYGIASTINSANYVLFLALEKVQQLGHPEVSNFNKSSIISSFI